MKYPLPHSFPRLALGCAFSLSLAILAPAQTSLSWNNTGTDFATGANWVGGVAPADSLTANIASFNSASYPFQPSLGTSQSVAGLNIGASSGVLNFTGTGTLTLGASGITNLSTTANQFVSVPLALGASSSFTNAGTLAFTAPLNTAGFTLTLGGTGSTGIASGIISGSGGVTKTGSGEWDLSAANTYTGPTIINGGTVIAGTGGVPTGSAITVNGNIAGGTAFFSLFDGGSVGSVTFGGVGATSTSTNTLSTNNTLTLGGTVTYDATNNPLGATLSATAGHSIALGGNRLFNIGNSTSTTSELTVNAPLTGSGQSLTKSGGGRLSLSGANTYDGGTVINAGEVYLNGSNTLASTGNVTVNATAASGTATLTLGSGFTQTIGALTLGATGGGASATNNVSIGTGSTLTLGGTVTYDATTSPGIATISGGTLDLGGNRTFNVGHGSGAADLLVGSVITGAGSSLTKTGAGDLALSVAHNTYSGGTIINGGSITTTALNNVLPVGGAITVNGQIAGATAKLTLNGSESIGTLTFGGAGASPTATGLVNLTTSNTLTLGGDVTYDATNNPLSATISGGTLTLGANRTFNVGNSTATNSELNVSSVISGSGLTLTKTGDGRLALNGANTYSGGTIVSGGELFLNASNTLTSTGTLTINTPTAGTTATVTLGGTFTQTIGSLTFGGTGATATSTNNLILNPGSALTLGGTVTYDATNNPLPSVISGSGTLALGGNRIFNIADSTNLSTSSELTISSVITGTGSSLTKTGSGRLTLSTANTYDGGTIINGGSILLGTNNALPSGGNLTINATGSAAAVLNVPGNITQTIGTLTFGGVGATTTSSNAINLGSGTDTTLILGGTVTYDATGNPLSVNLTNGIIALGANRIFNIGNSTSTGSELMIGSIISGSGLSLTKTGDGRLQLSGANTYSGGTIINGGELFLASNNTLLTTAGVTVNSNLASTTASFTLGGNVSQAIGTLTFGGSGSTTTSTNVVNIASGSTLTLGGTVTSDATGNPLGSVINGAGTLDLGANRIFNVGNSTSTTSELGINVAISGSGLSLTKTGGGRLTLAGANTYTGGTIVNAGEVFLNASNTLASTGSVTVNNTTASSTATLFLGTGLNQTIGALTLGGTGATATSTNNVSLNSGSTLTLGGDVTFDATNNPLASTISGGTLALGANRVFNVADTTSAGSDLFVSSVISGGFSLTKTGTGVLKLMGANTYTGDTTINLGQIFLSPSGGSNALAPSGNIIVNSTTAGTTALLNLDAAKTQTIGTLTFGGTGATSTSTNNVTLNSGSTLTLGGTVTYDATNNPLSTSISGSGTLALGGNRIFNIADSSSVTSELTVSSVISGTGSSLTKTGVGRLTLSGANTYDGGTIVNGGNIFLNANNTLASTGSVTVNSTTASSTATLFLGTGFNQTIGALTLGGAGATTTSTNNVTLNSGSTLTLGGTVTYDATNNPALATISGGTLALGATRTFNVGDSSTPTGSDLIVASVISGSGFGLVKSGAGQLGLSGINTFDGGVTVTEGFLQLNANNTLLSTGNVTINATAGATATLRPAAGISQTIGALTFGGSSATSTSTNNVSLNSGSTLTLGGTVTYDATNNPAVATISGLGTLALGGNRIFNVGDSSTPTASDLLITAPISGTGFGITKTGAGRLGLQNSDTFDGGVTINGGIVYLNSTNNIASTNNVTVNGQIAGASASFQLGTAITQTIGTLTFGGSGATATSTNYVFIDTGSALTLGGNVSYSATNNPLGSSVNGTGTLVLGATRTFDIAHSTNSTLSNPDFVVNTAIGDGGNAYGLIKTGTGVLKLSAVNTYTGGTTLMQGTLSASSTSGSSVGSGAFNVLSGATLTGGGFVGASLTTIASGGFVSPGPLAGPNSNFLTFTNSLTLNDGVVFNYRLGTASDKILMTGGTLTGALTAGSITLNLSNSGGFTAGVYTLFDYSGASATGFDATDFTLGTVIPGYTYNLAISGSTLQLTATASAIPEPSTYGIVAGVLTLAVAALRRKRSQISSLR